MERETYEGALNFGRKALLKLGLSERRALKAALIFREHDTALFKRLRPIYSQGEGYIQATRASRETFEQLVRAEMQRAEAEDDDTPIPAQVGGVKAQV